VVVVRHIQGEKPPVLLWQTKGHKRVTQGLFRDLRMSACTDNQVLSAFQTVGHWSGVAARLKVRRPQLFSSLDIKGADIGIKGASNKC
jgi:hypothetical protein